MNKDGLPQVTVAAVIATRNRVELLRQTLQSIQQSKYPVAEIIVSDDSSNDDTEKMLAEEFPSVKYLPGPRRGRAANRNQGMERAAADYILLCDDDMLVAPDFLESAVQQIHDGCDMAFAGVGEYGDVVYPNALGFLGFADKTYQTGETYHSSNQQCMLLSKTLAMNVRFDEYIEAYGYEEMDHSYRVAAAGYKIGCVSSCTNLHLAPTRHLPFRCEQDANRLYVTYKRYAYIEHRALKAFFYLLLAVPHNLLANVRRAGMKRGLTDSISNFYLAWRTLAKFWRKPLADIPKSASTLTVRS